MNEIKCDQTTTLQQLVIIIMYITILFKGYTFQA